MATPQKNIDDVEWVPMGWVDWFNSSRLHADLGDAPPDEFEADYYADLNTPSRPVMAPG
ncbi:hypothetical protein [Herbiconiux ginsengi]|uniref:hypothetical protein n=1 Tax=Herbiconiux ginsengi TaxID=381665 RepID=UPI00158744B8